MRIFQMWILKKYIIVSLFSGGGGLDLGFKKANFDIVFATDIDESAVLTYKKNISEKIIQADINTLPMSTFPDCDVIIGGPPCQAFSLAGKRDTDDPRAKLVFKYLEIIKCKLPKIFLMENVTGILSAKTKEGKKVIDELISSFKEIGYELKYNILEATDFGIPQKRRRVILVGTRKGFEFSFPKPNHGDGLLPYVTAYDALGDLPDCIGVKSGTQNYKCNPFTDYQKLMRLDSINVSDHFEQSTSQLDKYIIAHVKPGGNYMDIPLEVNSKRIRRLIQDGGHTTCYGRLDPNKPSY